jgi:hypothetical protein
MERESLLFDIFVEGGAFATVLLAGEAEEVERYDEIEENEVLSSEKCYRY